MTGFYLRNNLKHKEIVFFDFVGKRICDINEKSNEPILSGLFERIEGTVCGIVRPKRTGHSDLGDFFLIGDNHYFFDDASLSASYENLKGNTSVFILRKDDRIIKQIVHEPVYEMDVLGYSLDDGNSILFSIKSQLVSKAV